MPPMRACSILPAGAVLLLLTAPGVSHAAKPLSQVHAHLDNDDRCNSCHVAFSGVPDGKCLGCHRDIDVRLRRGKGYHARVAQGVACLTCHREHLGRGYDITPLDKRTFDHEKTGWPLTGGHQGVRCRECHTAKRPGSNRDSYLGADTAVVLDQRILGKPADRDDAIDMLLQLSGRTHEVLTGVAVLADRPHYRLSLSRVIFRDISAREAAAYWETGEPVDKAGSYAVQGLAAVFIERIEGSYSGIMGLPLFETMQILNTIGVYSRAGV